MSAFPFIPNLPLLGALEFVVSRVAASTSFSPLADRCLPASAPFNGSALIYNPEPSEQGLLRPDHHLVFGMNLERNAEPVGKGLPHLSLCCVVVQIRTCLGMWQATGAHIWKGRHRGRLNHAESSCTGCLINCNGQSLCVCAAGTMRPQEPNSEGRVTANVQFQLNGKKKKKASVQSCKGEIVWLCHDLCL